MFVNEWQEMNALSPILVTPLGIVTLVSEVQPENAEELILVTPLGIVNSVAVLPVVYFISVVLSLLYKFPSKVINEVLLSSTIMLVS